MARRRLPIARAVKTILLNSTFSTQSYYISRNAPDPDFNNGRRVATNFTDANNYINVTVTTAWAIC